MIGAILPDIQKIFGYDKTTDIRVLESNTRISSGRLVHHRLSACCIVEENLQYFGASSTNTGHGIQNWWTAPSPMGW